MRETGDDLRQHRRHRLYDVQSPSLSEGRIAYQNGADLRVYDIAKDTDVEVPITLVSDFDHMRERWIKNPIEWITGAHLSPTGDRVVVTARGQLYVVPAQQGRIADATRNPRVRFRQGRFFPDGKSLLALSDQSGEVEFWRVPANGIGAPEQLTADAKVLRWDGLPSPDGRFVAHHDKDQQLWIFDTEKKTQKKIAEAATGDFDDARWSPDSRWLVYRMPERNLMERLYLYNVASGAITPISSDRYDSFSPAWSPDGKWLYFLSNRHFVSSVPGPWGPRQPEPFFDKQTKVYHVSLRPGERSPFRPDDELFTAPKKESETTAGAEATKDTNEKGADEKGGAKPADAKVKPVPPIAVDLTGIESRLLEVPVPPGNYSSLGTDGKRLYFISRDAGPDSKRVLKTFAIDNKKTEVETFREDLRDYELSTDGKKVMLWTEREIFVVDAGAKAPAAAEIGKHAIPLKDWSVSLDPRDEWMQMFTEAWRLERDYFYDRGMHGVDWKAVLEKYRPLAQRVTDRAELSDVLAQMVSELSALHIFVRGGDLRRGQDNVQPGSLGATFARDEAAGGYRVTHIYRSDPDLPDEIAPLSRPGVEVAEGDVITAINGVPTLSAPDPAVLLRDEAGKQVLLDVKPSKGGETRRVVVVPITIAREDDLRYDEWELTRRQRVEATSKGRMGYVHLRAMGSGNMSEWQREFYPVFNREGLIIDVRHNRGGNIDSWVLEKLLRKAWFFWQPRVGDPYWNMQYAFRGHVVVLCNEFTASDGEAFAEGFRRLGLGKVIGTRTWGGEIWLSSSNVLVDRGIATAAETGVYGPEGEWLIEGHGVDPDIVVDNLPHATFKGEDAQLEAAITFLEEEIARKPIPVPPAPKYPTKTLTAPDAQGRSQPGGRR
jgi:tricorn protease